MPSDTTPRRPLGDARSDADPKDRAPTPGSLKQADVQNRENVGTVTPEDYPHDQRAKLDEAGLNRGRRAGTGSGPATGSGAGAGGKGNDEDYDSDPQSGGGEAEVRTDHGPKTGGDAPVGGSR
ncbi:hypothetical protein SKP52_03870 [Sphingopyxis fribergensis]|uniref:Uncharacterized protein n=1 Tax=Sphingopyxis fribergensis TaxID=1515612 RepID=A0A0A7PIH8_9SPHN|nr:hypothetical protein [Sphingopyxis fribergensis]AJA07702.1 hypothetical protein SKP52_03870 [Sphingopyxis fribergensis]